MSRPDALNNIQTMTANVGETKQVVTALWENRANGVETPFYGYHYAFQVTVVDGPATLDELRDEGTDDLIGQTLTFTAPGVVEVDVVQVGFSLPKRLQITVS